MDYTLQVNDTAKTFLEQLGMDSELELSTSLDPVSSTYQVSLTTDKPSLLIGYHGETLQAIQRLLGYHLNKLLGQWVSLSVNVNDYKERRESSVFALSDAAVQRVVDTKQPHSLPPMPSNERRLIHNRYADHTQVTTTSEGVGNRRMIIISPKV